MDFVLYRGTGMSWMVVIDEYGQMNLTAVEVGRTKGSIGANATNGVGELLVVTSKCLG